MTPDEVREWGRFATSSPTYMRIVESIATDPELIAVVNRIAHAPRLNILFAGVQLLMMGGRGGELAAFYPNFPGIAPEQGNLETAFRDFVLTHADELETIGRNRYTQTNECRRCVALVPAIWMLGQESFHLLDLGTSAGLNLLLDRYRYRWSRVDWGPADSPVILETENRGEEIVPGGLDVLSRTGLDLVPIDPTDPEERLWLEALVWPEQSDRRQRLRSATGLASSVDLKLVAGSALETLGPALSNLPEGEVAVVINSFVLFQMDVDQQEAVVVIIDEARRQRPVLRVSFEPSETAPGSCEVAIDDGSGLVDVGRADQHGEWIEFYARP
ncbi:MAG: DUF2332 domain-containing protein [Acidimicrobiia bacterium]|jgi:hypothetical protein